MTANGREETLFVVRRSLKAKNMETSNGHEACIVSLFLRMTKNEQRASYLCHQHPFNKLKPFTQWNVHRLFYTDRSAKITDAVIFRLIKRVLAVQCLLDGFRYLFIVTMAIQAEWFDHQRFHIRKYDCRPLRQSQLSPWFDMLHPHWRAHETQAELFAPRHRCAQ